jgi:hypothetical protein
MQSTFEALRKVRHPQTSVRTSADRILYCLVLCCLDALYIFMTSLICFFDAIVIFLTYRMNTADTWTKGYQAHQNH